MPSWSGRESLEPAAESRLQIRYSALHPSKKVIQCEDPKRWRWGQPPRDYRGLRKTWTARDMVYKKRDKFALKDVVKSNVPALGVSPAPAQPTEVASADAETKKDAGCSVRPSTGTGGVIGSLFGLLGLMAFRRRRSSLQGR